ncbi:universal stress protein [Streptomyces sp. NPDC023998]|uniref:universal stress protein n=1 Tax=Streptomyces sp. NPDC023998 TaxID=3154597 RepID=UPI00340B82FB
MKTSERPETGPVIAGVDGSANAATAVLWTAAEAAVLVLQHGRELLSATAARVAGRFPGLLSPPNSGVQIDEAVSVAGALVDASRRANLLAMGGRQAHHALGPALRRVTHAVLHHAHCPVKLVPPTK